MRFFWIISVGVCFFALCACAKQGNLKQSLQQTRNAKVAITPVEVQTLAVVSEADPLEEEFEMVKRDRPRMAEVLKQKGMPPVRPKIEQGWTIWTYPDEDCTRIFAFNSDMSFAWVEFHPKNETEIMSTK